MTQPVSHGYPDFSRGTPAADVLLVSATNDSTSTFKSYPMQFVGTQRALFVWASPSVSSMRVRLAFFGDAAGTIPLETTFIHASNGDLIIQPVRVLGPYVQVSVDAGGGVLTTYTIQVWASPDYGSFNSGGLLAGALSDNSTAIGAGATVIRDSGLVMAGPAVWSAFVSVAPWSATLIGIDYNGGATLIDVMNNNYSVGVPRPVYLPPTHIQLKVINGGAAGAFNATLTRLHP